MEPDRKFTLRKESIFPNRRGVLSPESLRPLTRGELSRAASVEERNPANDVLMAPPSVSSVWFSYLDGASPPLQGASGTSGATPLDLRKFDSFHPRAFSLQF